MFIQSVDAGPFESILPKGAKFYVAPKLPTIEMKRGKIVYTLPDFRLLHPAGVETVKAIIAHIAEYQVHDEVSFALPDDADKDTVEIACNIATAVTVNRKCGKREFDGCSIVYGTTTQTSKDGTTCITFYIADDFVQFVHKQSFEDGRIDFYKLLMDYADHEDAYLAKEMKRLAKEDSV